MSPSPTAPGFSTPAPARISAGGPAVAMSAAPVQGPSARRSAVAARRACGEIVEVRMAAPVREISAFVNSRPRRSATLASILALAIQMSAIALAVAAGWPPIDPNEEATAVVFTRDWATTVRDTRTLRQLQNAAGAGGKIVERNLGAEAPYVVFQWISVAPDGRKARMRANVFSTGDFGATILPIEQGDEIALNNFGAFVCRQCSPPIDACGRRPSWSPHDLHWDNFDCRCSLTGPQGAKAGQC
jgi:hypothetical protein